MNYPSIEIDEIRTEKGIDVKNISINCGFSLSDYCSICIQTDSICCWQVLCKMCRYLVNVARQRQRCGQYTSGPPLRLLIILDPTNDIMKLFLARIYLHLNINLEQVRMVICRTSRLWPMLYLLFFSHLWAIRSDDCSRDTILQAET